MSTFSLILMAVAMAAVLASLFGGLIAMARGGEFNRKYGNRFMRWRVMLQGLALLFFAIAVMSAGAG
ncbi:MAG: twin transmembrane helix small protein [Rhodospirillaceae bacterium]|nr:twin transmembrane helix small protein [Rhodospirillaceae bacterium]